MKRNENWYLLCNSNHILMCVAYVLCNVEDSFIDTLIIMTKQNRGTKHVHNKKESQTSLSILLDALYHKRNNVITFNNIFLPGLCSAPIFLSLLNQCYLFHIAEHFGFIKKKIVYAFVWVHICCRWIFIISDFGFGFTQYEPIVVSPEWKQTALPFDNALWQMFWCLVADVTIFQTIFDDNHLIFWS